MSTSCLIGIRAGDQVRYISAQSDGYPWNGTGQILAECYNTPFKIYQLLSAGDCWYIGKKPIAEPYLWPEDILQNTGKYSSESDPDSHKIVYGGCRAFRSIDSNVTSWQASSVNVKDYLATGQFIDYHYLFSNGRWLVSLISNYDYEQGLDKKWYDLESVLAGDEFENYDWDAPDYFEQLGYKEVALD